MSAPAKVVVRMYRNLLGDCFLIRLWDNSGNVSHILIDCGLLQGVDGAKERLTKIAQDINDTTGGRIDLLVITHEHWDHVGGFSLAKEILLDRIEYGNVWMAWTEDPKDAQATELRQRLADRKTAMAHVALALDGSDKLDELTLDLFKFIGPLESFSSVLGAAPEGRLTGGRVMEAIKKAAKKQPPEFLEPGDVRDTPGAVSVPTAVLGPPRSLARLKKDLPSQGDAKETYFGEEFLAFSLLGADSSGAVDAALVSPFSPRYQIAFNSQAPDGCVAFENGAPGTTPKWLYDHYFALTDDAGQRQTQRRIDGDWTAAASSLALKLDSDTNNTSLVLAFRLPNGNFLLFAADAQVGNWLSWHDQSYAFPDQTLSAADILRDTRLYKVGHHGSHNATLKARGLELMTHPELAAMISTIEEVAREQGRKGSGGWQMPDPEVKAALIERCSGRVIRGDCRWSEDKATAAHRDQPAFAEALDEKPELYVEITVYDPEGARAKDAKGEG